MKPTTPLLIDTNVPDFRTYINSLNKAARRNYRYVAVNNADLTFRLVPYNKPEVERFMNIWSQQTIHKVEPVKWGFDISHVNTLNDRGVLKVFEARHPTEGAICLHFVEDHGGYVYTHPPMYEKKKYSDRYLAKYMWFNLIKYAIEHKLGWIDMGAGDRGTWRDLILNREKYPRIAYKWMYVSEIVKENGRFQPNYYVHDENGKKSIQIWKPQ